MSSIEWVQGFGTVVERGLRVTQSLPSETGPLAWGQNEKREDHLAVTSM